MLNLTGTNDLIEFVTSSGADVDAHASLVELDNTAGLTAQTTDLIKEEAQSTTATTTTIVSAPASNKKRNVKYLNFRNIDGAVSQDITVQRNTSGTIRTLFKCTLLFGEVLTFREGVWFHYDANGGVYGQSLPVASTTVIGGIEIADQTEMETGTATDKAVTPGNIGWHPSSCKAWLVAGLTGNIVVSFNITSLTDTGTGVLTVTIGTDFSGANWACLATIEFASTTLAQSCTYDSRAAGSVVLRSVVEAGSSADPVGWSMAGFGDQ